MSIRSLLFTAVGMVAVSVAFAQSSGQIDLVGKLPITNLPIHDVWGYTDTLTGDRYALLGASNAGLRVIDVTDAADPQLVGTLSGDGVQAIDVKTWHNYAYVMGESLGVTGKVIDLTDPTDPQVVGTFPGAHNITISKDGFMYLSVPGVRIFDLNTDPVQPTLVYSDNNCDGHDISILGDTLYDFSDNCGTRIFDISQPDTLVEMGVVPPYGMFHHSGWPSEDGNYVFVCDELAAPSENDITVWDISNIQTPFLVDSFSDPTAYVHNLYVHGSYAFVSYYRAGFRVFDVSDPTDISLIAEYDTDSTASGPGYGGNFGLYTFWGSDIILASDEENGLYIFSFQVTTGIEEQNSAITDFSVYPNPATDRIVLNLSLERTKNAVVQLTDAMGKEVIKDEFLTTGGKVSRSYNLSDLNEGIYFITIQTENSTQTQKIILIR